MGFLLSFANFFILFLKENEEGGRGKGGIEGGGGEGRGRQERGETQ